VGSAEERCKKAPVDVVIVDHVEKVATEN